MERTSDQITSPHFGNPQARARTPQRLLGIWAHPDDESYLSAGLMARTVAAGGEVTVLTLTDGEMGFPEDDPWPKNLRALERQSELRTAMERAGVGDIRSLGIPDGGVAEAPFAQTVAAIAAVIDGTQAEVIVTFGPDGITGHSDHVANCTLATAAWLQAGRGELWYAAKTHEWLDRWRQRHDAFGIWMTEEPTGVSQEDIEVVLDLHGSALAQKRSVLAGHRSQTEAVSALFGDDEYLDWIAQETFRRPTPSELASADKALSDTVGAAPALVEAH